MKLCRLVNAWKSKKEQGSYVRPHSHRYHEVVYYRKGWGETAFGEEARVFYGGNFAYLPPDTEHDERFLASGSLLCIGFESDIRLPMGLYPDADGNLEQCAEQIVEEALVQGSYYDEMLSVKLRELEIRLARLCLGEEPKGQKDLRFVINYIRQNCHERLSVEELAGRVGLSADYFRHRFKEVTGMPPGEAILRARLEKACDLLEKGELSCTQIAYRCGFSSSAQFSMLFHRRYQMTPSAYLQAAKAKRDPRG